MKSYKILIKTDSYAGNFERQLCAHLTGHIGECEVGKEYVNEKIYEEFEDCIEQKPDENGHFRPVDLGKNSNDIVIFFYKQPTRKQIDIIRERIKTFKTKDRFTETPKIFDDIFLIEVETKENQSLL